MKVGIYGSGNLAWHLARWLSQKHIQLTGISGRNAEKCLAIWPEYLTADQLADDSDIVFLAIPDDAIADSAKKFIGKDCIVAHCSGATSLDALEGIAHRAVCWPLQSFTREMFMQYDQIHVFIETSTPNVQERLLGLWRQLTENIHVVDKDERKMMHLAAVFASNYVNHLLHISEMIASMKGPGLVALQPLIEEIISKAFLNGPFDSQTGPARRGDVNTIHTHLELLTEKPEWQNIYRDIAASIQSTYGKLQTDPE